MSSSASRIRSRSSRVRSAGDVVGGIIESTSKQKSKGVVGTVVGVVIALFGASGVFGQLQDALNTIWGVKAKPGLGIMGFLKARFVSFGMVGGVCFLLLVSHDGVLGDHWVQQKSEFGAAGRRGDLR